MCPYLHWCHNLPTTGMYNICYYNNYHNKVGKSLATKYVHDVDLDDY
jgi:hypothetical protein